MEFMQKRLPQRFNPRWILVLIIVTIFVHIALYQPHRITQSISWNNRTIPILLEGCPDALMILADNGRMGNRFFEFLAGKIFAEQLNRTLNINQPFCNFILSYFDGLHTPVYGTYDTFKQRCNLTDANFTNIDTNGVAVLDPVYSTTPYIILLWGVPDFFPPSTWNVLHDRREELLEEFQWRSDVKDQVSAYIDELTANRAYSKLIGVHVRMTDYPDHMDNLYGPSRIPGVNYFNKSMSYYRKKFKDPLFLVVSDDMKWCQETLRGDDVIFGGKGNETDPGWDLTLLTSCDHLIITYGSYGTMAAFFIAGKGEVIAADNFTSSPNTFSENIRQSKWPNWNWMPID